MIIFEFLYSFRLFIPWPFLQQNTWNVQWLSTIIKKKAYFLTQFSTLWFFKARTSLDTYNSIPSFSVQIYPKYSLFPKYSLQVLIALHA